MREIDTGIKVAGHAFMIGKFPAIVIGDDMRPIDVRGKPVYDGIPDCPGYLMEDTPDNRIQRLELDQRYQGTLVALADHGITFPVTEASLAIDNGRAIISRNLLGDAAPPVIGAIAFTSDLLTTQIPVQVAA